MPAEPEAHADRGAARDRGHGEARISDAGVQEGLSINPYAPPQAKVDPAQQVGELWRRGALVRMERSGALPDRCITCNANASGYRLGRKLYWSPVAWKMAALATPFAVAGLGVATQSPMLLVLFWPLALVLMIAHTFVRKKVEIDLGVCERHRRLRVVLRGLSIACLLIIAAIPVAWQDTSIALPALWGAIAALIALAIAQSFIGVQAVKVKELTDQHAWLARTGEPFRAALPELPR